MLSCCPGAFLKYLFLPHAQPTHSLREDWTLIEVSEGGEVLSTTKSMEIRAGWFEQPLKVEKP